MRDLIFRGKRINTGEWVEGGFYKHLSPLQYISENTEKSKYYIIRTGFADWDIERPINFIEVYKDTVGQYTGLKDCKGMHKIYEYDIISKNGEKVGNYYENPNLLKESTNLLIKRMGTKEWRNSEQKAIECGCYYAK